MEKQIVRFNERDSRIGNHSYSGFTLYHSLCDGKCHYEVREPDGLRGQDTSCQKLGPCDGTCQGGKPVDPLMLPGAAQETMGIKVTIPAGKILVLLISYNVQQYGYYNGYHVVGAGEEVTPADMKNGTLLAEGEATKVHQTNSLGYQGKDYLVRNVGGQSQATLHPDEVAKQKKFAADQIAKITAMGFSHAKAVAIMRAAGPGLCVKSAEWAKKTLKTVNHDLLEAVLRGCDGKQFGFRRAADTIRQLGVEPPEFYKATPFFKFTAGALAAM